MSESTNVIDIKDRLPKMTAERLINDAKTNCSPGPIPLSELIEGLPELLHTALECLLSDFDYIENRESDHAIAARLLAIGFFRLTESLEAKQ